MPEIGQTVSHYRIIEKLGRGDRQGILAHDTSLDRRVYLQFLPDVSGNPERLARFEREAKLLASLNNSNIADRLEQADGHLGVRVRAVRDCWRGGQRLQATM